MDWTLSLMALTTIALVLGGVALLRRGATYRRQALLMLVLAAVMAANLVIWTLPDRNGATLAGEAEKGGNPVTPAT